MSAPPESTLANPEQLIAELQRQLAECGAELTQRTAERDEALEQQTATAEVLGVINSSPGELTPVFEAILDKAHSLCGAEYGALLTFDGDEIRCVAAHGEARFVETFRQMKPVRPPRERLARLMGGPFQLPDAHSDPGPYGDEPEYRRLIDLGGIRTILITPLRKDDMLLGVITAYRQEVRPFTDRQIALLQNFAAQAVIAMENARLLTETREALEQQTATAEILRVISRSPTDLQPTFNAIAANATILSSAEAGVVFRFDGSLIHYVAHHGYAPNVLEAIQRDFPIPPGRHSTTARAILTREVAHIPDAAADPEYGLRAILQTGVHTMLSVPILQDGNPVGAITVTRREVEPFSQAQIDLLKTFADQAVIAIENVRLFNETREALEQQTATAEILQVINSSPGDLASVFDAMLDKAMRLCEAPFGALRRFDGEVFRAMAARDASGAVAVLGEPIAPDPGSASERLVLGDEVVHIPDVVDTEAYRSGVPSRLRFFDMTGARTALWVALRKNDALLGDLALYRKEVRPFGEKQIALLQNFASQAVIAMENARLINETREALEQQTATAEVLQVINSSPGDLTPVFEAILEKAHALCGADLGSFAINNGERMPAVATRGYPEEHARLAGEGLPTNTGFGQRLARGEIVHDLDLRQPADVPDPTVNAMRRAAVELTGTRTYLAVPLRKDGALLGYISAHRREVRPFTDKQIALLQNFAAQAVIAMENARLLTETREALDQQTATAEVLQVINSSPGDLAPVFDAMLEKALHLCGAAYGSMHAWDGEAFPIVALRGVPPALVEVFRERELFKPTPGNVAERIAAGETVIRATDLREEPHYLAGARPARAIVELGAGRSYACIALRKDNALLGALTMWRTEIRPFTDKQIALLQSFAAQAVIAMENARLLGELRERTHQLEQSLEYQTATSDVLQVISRSTFDLKPVLDTVIHTAARLCQAEVGHIATRDGDVYRPLAGFGVSPTEREALIRTRVFNADNTTVVGRAVSEGKVIHVADVQTEPAYASSPVVVRSTGVRTILAVPLLRLGEPIGVLSLGRWRVESFTDRQIELVRTFADQAVIAMENARLLGELRQRTDEVVELNRGLETRVAEQVEELGRVGRLKRFLAPQLAELIVSQGDEKILESHRREIVVVFCDLRGYTAFTETAEPEEVLDFLREYHGALGPLVSQFEGTLDQFSGDGIMVFFNDPVPCSDPAERAVKMAMAMREEAGTLIASWRRRGRLLGFGAGIAQGYATLGQIGFAERSGYTAIGTVCNLAARLCAEAEDGQILIAQRVAVAVEETMTLEEVGALTLKGLTQPVVAYNVPLAPIQPTLRVIEGGPQSV